MGELPLQPEHEPLKQLHAYWLAKKGGRKGKPGRG